MMEKKALQLASVASMIDQFNIPNIEILQSLGYRVDVVANFSNPGSITPERCENLKNRLNKMGVRVFDVAIPRTMNFFEIRFAYKQVRQLLEKEKYNLLHCHSPIGGVIARQASKALRQSGLKVIYTAHGFHFYHGAPLKNWFLFYPIERYYSKYTDVLITINTEDYERASRTFSAKKTVYIPGVGVDLDRFALNNVNRKIIRNRLGINDKKVVLSVGELNKNKNHRVVIQAIKDLPEYVYVIVGRGVLEKELKKLAFENNVDLRLMGYRNDVDDFYKSADLYVLPSKREGLNVSLMEAMASGLPCIASDIRGNRDLIDKQGGYLVSPKNIEEWKKALTSCSLELLNDMGAYNLRKIKSFSINMVRDKMKELYEEL